MRRISRNKAAGFAALLFCIGAHAQSPVFEESRDRQVAFSSRQSGFTSVFHPGSVEFDFPRARPVTLHFLGSSPRVRLAGEGRLPGQTTYFLAASKVSSGWFEKVRYRDLYPGIDLIFYHAADGALEYDFLVAPGADPSRIELSFDGARITADNGLTINAPHHLLRQKTPAAYQGTLAIPADYKLSKDCHVRFSLGHYDPALPLIIDPVLVYTNFVGGDRTDVPNAVAVDSQGNAYLAGTTNSYNFSSTQVGPAPPQSGNLLTSVDGGKTYAHAPIANPVLSMAALPTALLAGTTAGPYRSVDGGNTWLLSNNGIANFATNALLTDSRYPETAIAGTDQGLFRSNDAGVTWNPTGPGLPASAPVNVIVASPSRPNTVFALANQGVYISQDFTQTWTPANLPINPFGPSPGAIAIDPSNPNVVYVSGAYSNTTQQAFFLKSVDGGTTFQQISTLAMIASSQAIAVDPANSSSLFAAGIDETVYHSADGGHTWAATSLTSVNLDAVAFDPNHPGNLYALADQGLFLSSDHGVTWQPAAASAPMRNLRTVFFTLSTLFLGQDSGEHVFLTKWNAAGTQMLWSIVLGGSYFDSAAAIAIDSSGNPYLAGTTGSTDFPVTPGAFQSTLKAPQNIFVTKLNSSGNQLLYSTLIGGSSLDGVSALAVDAAGSAYLTGVAISTDFPTTPGSYEPRHVGTCAGQAVSDAFVSKFSPGGTSLVYSTLIGGSCSQLATSIAIDSAGHAFVAGATFSADFPTTKGVLQTTYGGSADGFLSELTPAGNALVFSTYLGGPNNDVAAGVAVDSNGNIYVGGNGVGFSFVAPPPVSLLQCDGALVSFAGLSISITTPPYLLKVSPGAASIESLQNFAFCGTVVQSFALDSSGKAWLGGVADPTTYDTVAPFQALAAGTSFVRQFAADAQTVLFSSLLDSFQAVALDSTGAAYIAAQATAPGIVKQVPAGGTAQPSAEILKIDNSVADPVEVDTVQKNGTLSIPALAGYSGPLGVAPGELITLSGRGLGPASAAGTQVTNGLVATTVANVTVRFDGIPAPLISVQNNQIVCVAPYEISGRQRTQIQVVNNGVAANPVTVSVTPSVAEVLQLINQDGTINSASNPAPVGSIMTLYVSGLGLPAGSAVDGSTGAAIPQTFPLGVSVIYDDPATLTYLGPAPGLVSGITQINYIVPQIDGQSILSLSAGNSTDYVYVYVQ